MVTYGDIKIKKFDIIKLFLYICIVKKILIMPKSKGRKKTNKSKKKNIIVPMTDANQHIREHNTEKIRQNKALIKKIAEYKAKQEMAQQNAIDNTSKTIDGMK